MRIEGIEVWNIFFVYEGHVQCDFCLCEFAFRKLQIDILTSACDLYNICELSTYYLRIMFLIYDILLVCTLFIHIFYLYEKLPILN